MAPRKEVRARQKAGAGRQGTSGAKDRDRAGPPAVHPALRRRRRFFWMGVVGFAVLGIAFLGAFPARTYFRQQSANTRAEAQLRDLDTEITTLEAQIDRLQTDSEIEAQAREDFQMARPGEEPITLLPAAPPPVEVPAGWPYSRLFAASR